MRQTPAGVLTTVDTYHQGGFWNEITTSRRSQERGARVYLMGGYQYYGIFLMIEQTITIGNIIEIASILGGGLVVLITLKNTVTNIKSEVAGMQLEIKKLGEILIAQADIRGELKVLNTRVAATEEDIRGLRKGEGWITSRRITVDGEYQP